MFEPIIKWSGSKRSQASSILEYFPKEIDTYYEPFCGGCSLLRRLLDEVEKGNISVKHFICSDINSDLISLWNEIKKNPNDLIDGYTKHWTELNKDDDKNRKRAYFESVRDSFNTSKSPLDFLFIMRTTTNGMPRYNKSGQFNNSFHITRDGIKPETLKKILLDWNKILNKYDVEFRCCSYLTLHSSEKDVVYLDPPYANTKGMYYGKINYEELWNWLRTQDGLYYLSFDGKSGNVDNTYSVPEDVYTKHEYIKSGNSSFKRVIGNSKDSIVYESLYLK